MGDGVLEMIKDSTPVDRNKLNPNKVPAAKCTAILKLIKMDAGTYKMLLSRGNAFTNFFFVTLGIYSDHLRGTLF